MPPGLKFAAMHVIWYSNVQGGRDMNNIVNMILRQVMRRLVSKGVNAGFNKASKLRSGQTAPAGSPEERRRQKQARQASQRARKSMKVMRRMSKF
jgi:hypothetical protein